MVGVVDDKLPWEDCASVEASGTGDRAGEREAGFTVGLDGAGITRSFISVESGWSID
jgi:hypothetical protein